MKIVAAAAPPFFKNGFLVVCDDTGEAVLIDPGDETGDLLQAVESTGAAVTAILLTHAHIDHITGVRRAKAALNVPVWLHRADLPLYDAVVEQGLMFGVPVERQPPIDRFYTPGEPIHFGRCVVDVYHTPGHCPGGVCLAIGCADDPRRELVVGDTLFAGSIGRTDLYGADHETLLASIRNVLLQFPDETVVYPGHGPQTTVGTERRTNPFLR